MRKIARIQEKDENGAGKSRAGIVKERLKCQIAEEEQDKIEIKEDRDR